MNVRQVLEAMRRSEEWLGNMEHVPDLNLILGTTWCPEYHQVKPRKPLNTAEIIQLTIGCHGARAALYPREIVLNCLLVGQELLGRALGLLSLRGGTLFLHPSKSGLENDF